jgi:hypothetical protein
LSCSIPLYNYLIDKLEDEIDEKNNEKFKNSLLDAIEKLKKYYSYTGGLIYTIATGKLNYYLYNFIIFILILVNNWFIINSFRSKIKTSVL